MLKFVKISILRRGTIGTPTPHRWVGGVSMYGNREQSMCTKVAASGAGLQCFRLEHAGAVALVEVRDSPNGIQIGPPKGIEVRDFVLKSDFSYFSSIFIKFPFKII